MSRGFVLPSQISPPIAAAGGLVPITPSSIAVGSGTATSAGNGQVTFTSVTTSLSLNGVFSSLYTNYRILIQATSVAGLQLRYRMRVAGTNDASASYDTQTMLGEAGGVYAGPTVNYTSSVVNNSGSATDETVAMDIFRPFLATPTSALYTFNEGLNSTSINLVETIAGLHDESTSYDGISFLVSQAATGTVSVYGYAI